MTVFDKKKIIEIVLYILEKTGGTDIYHVLKTFYFAERMHLAQWGSRMTTDTFRAYDYGPVPEALYHASKNNVRHDGDFARMFSEAVENGSHDAHGVLLPKRRADMSFLSRADVECLDASIRENSNLSFKELLDKSHDRAWMKADFARKNHGSDLMDTVSIAEAAGADEGMMQYVMEMAAADAMLA